MYSVVLAGLTLGTASPITAPQPSTAAAAPSTGLGLGAGGGGGGFKFGGGLQSTAAATITQGKPSSLGQLHWY